MKTTFATGRRSLAPVFLPMQKGLFQEDDMPTKSQNTCVVNVAKLRADHGLTIKEMAALLGVGVSTYTGWEYGGENPSGAALSLLQIMAARPDVIYEVLGPLQKKTRAGRGSVVSVKAKKSANVVAGKDVGNVDSKAAPK